ncbi:hypothetical protein [Massilia psychrophila]|jgi:hypothetical protein|uniref:Uncharacterized protein n=1 Tax=Massilia psychrophila TaxID=1603353 RepID=A0A2G8T4S1_9BURK|nr:hypothetical protein [Massilia psychrophila]PIL40979.1 hypothetical protein CR103_04365 [Massilia psychrophila]GGE68799.1 hypothetical protein GCM10008020_11500 [Massilia psychrophila]
MSISEATLRRVERGDAGTGAGAYLAALRILGVIGEATPALAPFLWSATAHRKAKLSKRKRGSGDDDDYF